MSGGPALVAETAGGTYPIHLGDGLLDRAGELVADACGRAATAMVVHDANVEAYADTVAGSLSRAGLTVARTSVPAGEGSKSLDQLERICREAARAGVRRRDVIVAVGGGVVGDLAGFAAASYQRGVALVHVPTTLLAMVDSAIGGKTGVDLPEGKNYVGAIHQPAAVIMDTATLSSLPARELSCGFAEVVKYGLLDGEELFERVEGWPQLPGPADELSDLIRRCVAHKVAVVAADERDLGVRATLNLGHTVGHGIEAAAGYSRYHHGEAISLGLLAALRISEQIAGLDPQWRERTRAVLARHGLPVELDPAVGTPAIEEAMGRDKKADAASLNMVVVPRPGAPQTNADPGRERVREAIEELRG